MGRYLEALTLEVGIEMPPIKCQWCQACCHRSLPLTTRSPRFLTKAMCTFLQKLHFTIFFISSRSDIGTEASFSSKGRQSYLQSSLANGSQSPTNCLSCHRHTHNDRCVFVCIHITIDISM